MRFISSQHARNVAADLRERAEREAGRADLNVTGGDLFGAAINRQNIRVLNAEAKLADQAAELLGDGS